MRRNIIILLSLLLSLTASAKVNMRVLGDSLTAFTGFSRVWAQKVKVTDVRVHDDNVVIYTKGPTLGDFAWSEKSVADLRKRASNWVLGKEDGNVTIYANNIELAELITECSQWVDNGKKATGKPKQNDLSDRNIAMWPSHGMYYNKDRDEWIWQRATLWTTVEDLYSQEYVRLVKRMLENAGATVYMPRPGVEASELGRSGMPHWAEGARYWLQSQGVSSSIWNLYDGNEYKDDMKCRALWVNSLKAPIDLCLALHTDGLDSGNDSTIVGTLCIYTAKDDDGKKELRDGRDRAETNRNLADWIQTQLVSDLQYVAPEWTRRQLHEANYCESRVPVVPSLILEVLSHKNFADMHYGLDPKFRRTAARAIYKGILRYLNGANAYVQPLPVEEIAIDTDGTIRWQPQLDSIEPTAKPTYYMLYIQQDDGDWDVEQVDKTEKKIDLQRGVRYNCYVVAGNKGGLSLPSPTVSAYLSERDDAPIALIVDGFSDTYGPQWFADATYAGIVPGSYACEDGFSCAYIGEQWDFRRDSKWVDDDNCGWGSCYRDNAGFLTIGNTHDFSVQHGRALRKMRISYCSSTESMAQIDSTFAFIDYIGGRQLRPMSTAMQEQIGTYLTENGRLLLSGENLSTIDTAWLYRYTHAQPHARRATRSGRITSPLHRLYMLVMTPNEEQLFCPMPESFIPYGDGAKRMAEYQDMRCGAAVGWKNDDASSATLLWGFPLEAVSDFEKIYRHSVEWLMKE